MSGPGIFLLFLLTAGSRWGHRIPAYSISLNGHSDESDNERWVTGRTEEEAFTKAKAKFKDVPEAQISLQRDPDVLVSDPYCPTSTTPVLTPTRTPGFLRVYGR